MVFSQFEPAPDLKRFISCYWTLHFKSDFVQQAHTYDLALPDGCSDLIINLGSGFVVKQPHRKESIEFERFGLVGQRDHCLKLINGTSAQLFAIRFQPYGLGAFVDSPVSELFNTIQTDAHINKLLVADLWSIVDSVETIPSVLPKIEAMLRKKMNHRYSTHPLVETAIKHIVTQRGHFSVQSFCNNILVHRSTLEKAFQRQVGMSPKEYATIIRFNESTLRIQNLYRQQTLTDVAFDCGYYDQSHMTKEFNRFTGLSPTDFLKERFRVPDMAVQYYKTLQSQESGQRIAGS